MPAHVVRWAEAVEVPWKNGGGITRELVVEGGATFDWRLSAATIDSDGPFSDFPGVDRVLVLLRGNGVVLEIDGAEVRLASPGDGVEFAGEARVASRLVDGPTVDLNLMTRREVLSRTWAVVATGEPAIDGPADVVVVHVLDGTVTVDGDALAVGDTVWWERDDAAPTFGGEGSLVRFGLGRLH